MEDVCVLRDVMDEILRLCEETEEEEEQWFARKRLNGVKARLVRYAEDQDPTTDIPGLVRTRLGRIMVTSVLKGGPASRAGVVAGDQLISVDGQKTFEGRSVFSIRESMQAPVTLVFVGFVGKLDAEVQLQEKPKSRCGLPAAMDIAAYCTPANSPVQLRDTVVFHKSEASLLIATDSNCIPEDVGEGITSCMYELQREDASRILKYALLI